MHQESDCRKAVFGSQQQTIRALTPILLTVSLKVVFVFVFAFVYFNIPARRIAQYSKNKLCCVQGPLSWRGKYYQYSITIFCPDSQQVETLTTTDPYSLCLAADGTHTQVSPMSLMYYVLVSLMSVPARCGPV